MKRRADFFFSYIFFKINLVALETELAMSKKMFRTTLIRKDIMTVQTLFHSKNYLGKNYMIREIYK